LKAEELNEVLSNFVRFFMQLSEFGSSKAMC